MEKIGLGRITTGPSIQGWEIQRFLGPVSANVVAGTGMFSDLAAGLSDIFGGRSGAYQKQLDVIKSEALEQIARAGASRGANWIIGLTLDFDEISGKGKQLLMVSAVGTAVLAVCQTKTEDSIGERIQPRQLESYMTRADLLAQLQAGDLADNAKVRQDLVEHVVGEGLPWLFERQASAQPYAVGEQLPAAGYAELVDELLRKLEAAELGSASPRLYECLAGAKAASANAITDAIVRNSLTSFPAILEGLSSGDARVRIMVLQTIKGSPQYYSQADIPILRQIQQICETGFPQLATTFEKKGLLGKKILTHCPCGCDFDHSECYGYCPQCGRDPFGFPRGYVTPATAGAIAAKQAHALERMLTEAL